VNEALLSLVVPSLEGREPIPVEVVVRDTGEGEHTLLCLHGFGDNLHTWQELRALLEPRGARVVAVDLPGFGRSPLPPRFAQDYTLHAVQLTRLLAARYRAEKKPLLAVGNSLGGVIALCVAATGARGERAFDALLLLAPATPETRTPIFMHLLRAPVYRWSEQLKGRLSEPARLSFARFVARAAFRTILARGARPSADWWESTVVSFARPGAFADVERIARDLLWILRGQAKDALDLLRDVEHLSTPTVIMRGDQDRIGARELDALARRIPGARLITLPGVGHCPQNEAPAAVAEACLELLDAVRASRA
jgi:pimeloyl-ACP methyl ester carboxylesterase